MKTVPVRVSAKMARLLFHGCDPEYIRDVCRARCCESSTAPSGISVAVHPAEVSLVEARGGKVEGGLLQPRVGEKKCPFKTAADLCGLHETPAKPFGCIASPFTLNAKRTLIVRNRYRLLRCYKDGPAPIPAYRAFRASLDLLFGRDEAARVAAHLDAGGGDVVAEMPALSFQILAGNTAARAAAGGAP